MYVFTTMTMTCTVRGGGYILDNVLIKKKAWGGSGVIILKGVTIGENSVIASGSIVTKDVPNNSILIQKRQSTYKEI